MLVPLWLEPISVLVPKSVIMVGIDWIGRNQHQIVGGVVEGDPFGAAWVHESEASLFCWFEMVQLGVSSHFQSK